MSAFLKLTSEGTCRQVSDGRSPPFLFGVVKQFCRLGIWSNTVYNSFICLPHNPFPSLPSGFGVFIVIWSMRRAFFFFKRTGFFLLFFFVYSVGLLGSVFSVPDPDPVTQSKPDFGHRSIQRTTVKDVWWVLLLGLAPIY
jgi:hypothetical protein